MKEFEAILIVVLVIACNAMMWVWVTRRMIRGFAWAVDKIDERYGNDD